MVIDPSVQTYDRSRWDFILDSSVTIYQILTNSKNVSLIFSAFYIYIYILFYAKVIIATIYKNTSLHAKHCTRIFHILLNSHNL